MKTKQQIESEVHESHSMSEWAGGIVCILITPRFGETRFCRYCQCEQAASISGHWTDPNLKAPCETEDGE